MEKAHDLVDLLAQRQFGIGLEQSFGPLSSLLRDRRQKPWGAFGDHGWTKCYRTGIFWPQNYDDKLHPKLSLT
jgi:hypothetical protein